MKQLIKSIPLILGVLLISYSFSSKQNDRSPQTSLNQPPVETNCEHLPYGIPTGTPPTNTFICRDTYAISNNRQTKFADWVAYRITDAQLKCQTPKERK